MGIDVFVAVVAERERLQREGSVTEVE